MATELLKVVARDLLQVLFYSVLSFCGFCLSIALAMTWARFYTRSMYHSPWKGRRDTNDLVRRSHQAVRNLRFWLPLARQDLQYGQIRRMESLSKNHKDALKVRFSAPLKFATCAQGFGACILAKESCCCVKEVPKFLTMSSRWYGSLSPVRLGDSSVDDKCAPCCETSTTKASLM